MKRKEHDWNDFLTEGQDYSFDLAMKNIDQMFNHVFYYEQPPEQLPQ